MRNLGPVSRAWLDRIHVHNMSELRELGSVLAYVRIRISRPKVSRNLLWAPEGALIDEDCRLLPRPLKDALWSAACQASEAP